MTISRLLPIQQNYLEGMKYLLEVYYLLSSLEEVHWFSDKPIQMIAKLFTFTIPNFSKSIFYWDGYTYHMKYGDKNTEIKITNLELKKFLKIVSAFYEDVSNNRICTAYNIKKSTMFIDSIPGRNEQLSSIKVTPAKRITETFQCKIYRQPNPWHSDESFNIKVYDQIHADLFNGSDYEKPDYREAFFVDIDLDSRLIYTLSTIGPSSATDQDDIIMTPSTIEDTYFCDAIRYIFAKYFSVFGSFDRIKICLNHNCKRLFVEKKFGVKVFCGKKCRMEYNANHQPRNVRLCRERQNQWLRGKLNHKGVIFRDPKTKQVINPPAPDHVKKEDCDMCTVQSDTGFCLVVMQRNQALNMIEKIELNHRSKKFR